MPWDGVKGAANNKNSLIFISIWTYRGAAKFLQKLVRVPQTKKGWETLLNNVQYLLNNGSSKNYECTTPTDCHDYLESAKATHLYKISQMHSWAKVLHNLSKIKWEFSWIMIYLSSRQNMVNDCTYFDLKLFFFFRVWIDWNWNYQIQLIASNVKWRIRN